MEYSKCDKNFPHSIQLLQALHHFLLPSSLNVRADDGDAGYVSIHSQESGNNVLFLHVHRNEIIGQCKANGMNAAKKVDHSSSIVKAPDFTFILFSLILFFFIYLFHFILFYFIDESVLKARKNLLRKVT